MSYKFTSTQSLACQSWMTWMFMQDTVNVTEFEAGNEHIFCCCTSSLLEISHSDILQWLLRDLLVNLLTDWCNWHYLCILFQLMELYPNEKPPNGRIPVLGTLFYLTLVKCCIVRWAWRALWWQLFSAIFCLRADPLCSNLMQLWMNECSFTLHHQTTTV